MQLRWLLALSLLIGCNKREDTRQGPTPQAERSQPPMTAPPSKANAHADAADAKALPASGMVCRGDKVYVWTQDDVVEPLRAIRPAPGRDGQIYETYESVHSLAPGAKPVKYQEGGKSPRVAITSGTSLLVQVSDTRVDVLRDAAWKQVTLPTQVREVQAVEVANEWWLAGGEALLRVTAAGTAEKVATPAGLVRGVLPVGDALWVVTTTDTGGKYFVGFAKRDDTGAFKSALTVPLFVNGTSQHAIGTDRAAILMKTSTNAGTVYLIDGAGKPTAIAEGVDELGTFDGSNRLWYRTQTAMVAHASDGTRSEYPLASKPMFAGRWGSMCYPFGGGFTQLPGAGAVVTGTLTIDVLGAGNLPFVACDSRHTSGQPPCTQAPNRITGTFGGAGRWSGPVAIGNYSFSVQRGGTWLVPAIDGTAKRSCQVQADAECTLTATLPP